MPRTPSQMDSKMSVEKVTTNLRYLRPDPRPDLDGSGEGDQLEDNNRDAEIVVVGRLLFLLLCLLGEEPIIYRGELQGELDGVEYKNNTKYKIQHSKCKIQDTKYKQQNTKCPLRRAPR